MRSPAMTSKKPAASKTSASSKVGARGGKSSSPKKSSVASNPNPQPSSKPLEGQALAKKLEEDTSAKGLQEVTVPKEDRETALKLGPAPIQTAEDAKEQFLRGLLTEEEFEAAMGRFGVQSGQFANRVEPVDAAFHNKLPDYYKEVAPLVFDDVETRLAAVEEKAKVRETAEKAAERVKDNSAPAVADEKNQASREAVEKL